MAQPKKAKNPRDEYAQKQKKMLSFMQLSRLRRARSAEYVLQSIYKYGYRNKEDVSNLPPQTLVVGSQNVLTNAAEQVTIRNGYTLDGPAGTNVGGIDSSYDLQTATGFIRNLRKWGTTLEVRYVNPVTNLVSWIALGQDGIAGPIALNSNFPAHFAPFFDQNTEQKNFCLFVNHANNIWEWSGGVGSVASSTSNSVTLQGILNTDQLGFYSSAANSGKFQFVVNGIVYRYTSAGTISVTAFTGSGSNTASQIEPTVWWSQGFTTGASAQSITNVSMSLYWNNSSSSAGTTINFVGQIYTDNSGVPGTPIGNPVSASYVVGAPNTYTGLLFNFSYGNIVLPVAAATKYHFVVSSDQYSYLYVVKDTSGGQITNTSNNSGSTWSSSNGPLNIIVIENDTSPQTLNGVTPAPSGMVVGDAVVQAVAYGSSSQGVNGLPTNFIFDLIANEAGQMWYGNKVSTAVYVSAQGNYKDVTYNASGRLFGQGAVITLDAPPVAFKQNGALMYCSAGLDEWWVEDRQKLSYTYTYVIGSTPVTVTTVTENLTMGRLKTAAGQGAQSQSLVGELKNALIYVSNEPIFNSFGPVKNVYQDPQIVNMSDPIKYDFDSYNFAGGQVFYYNYYIYITLPAMGVVRIYNVRNKYWEAPQLLPVSRFYIVGGQLYGHSSLTNESYQMFVGYSDNGNPIKAVAAFPYVTTQGGSPNEPKNFNKFFTEGYIAGNTALTVTLNYDFGGFSGNYSVINSGANPAIIFNKITDGSLGQNTLGSEPIGSVLNLTQQPPIPKFRVVNTFPRVNCFEYQVVYSSDDTDQNWALLRFGPAIQAADDLPTAITL